MSSILVNHADLLVTMDGAAAATTDLQGDYSFTTTVEAVHTVVETDPTGYFSTTSNEKQFPLEFIQ